MSKLSHSDDESMRKIEAEDRAGMHHDPDPNWRAHAPQNDVGADMRKPRHIYIQSDDDGMLYRVACREMDEKHRIVELLGGKWVLQNARVGAQGFTALLMEVFEIIPGLDNRTTAEMMHDRDAPRPHSGGPNTGETVALEADRPKSGKPEPLVADFLTEQTMWEARFGGGSPKPGHLDAWAAENPPTTREQTRAQATEPQPDPQYLTASEGLGMLSIMSQMARGVETITNRLGGRDDGHLTASITSLRLHIERRIGKLQGESDPVERARVLSGNEPLGQVFHTAIEPLTREQVAALPHLARVIVEWPNIEGRRAYYTVQRDHTGRLLASSDGRELLWLYSPDMPEPYTPRVWRRIA